MIDSAIEHKYIHYNNRENIEYKVKFLIYAWLW